ncbi:heterocyst differentiation protein [Richelia sinica FACHB-800]|uniref:Heterocyst differentiation protein n=1 Tax=Richelia sinica FACHB-800 TaxID=1357546 RepID=A0A975T660_9NOST|nr:HetP family heterocyst commitment protein [Richelia sinica]MBD2663674.1 HetP family heterocyst commitment protein [Richelia sinica FACHB-800]QXE22764.1 heterocyst differentiation protein [Richelia sinica FACHB-800]
MNQDISGSSSLDKKIHSEQLDQVVEAILAGKYSWACVLMLRFVGYNPMHYIPYRTYNRLLKENSRLGLSNSQQNEKMKIATSAVEKRSDSHLKTNCLNKLKDIAYLEVGGKQKAELHGSNREQLSA